MVLIKMGAALLLFAVACFLPGPAAAQLPTETDVLVVGAGMAGVTAAALLQQSNVSVILLEGRNRPGGRLQSTSVQGGGGCSARHVYSAACASTCRRLGRTVPHAAAGPPARCCPVQVGSIW